MKKLFLLTFGFFILFNFSAEAQFLKKLQKKVQEKVEDAVVDNVSNKAEQKTHEKLNQMWETNLGNGAFPIGAEMVDPAEIPDTYNFSWEYSLTMKTGETEMEMNYYLQDNSEYVGIKVPQSPDMFMVLDSKNDMMVMYLASEGNKFLTATKFTNTEEASEEEFDQSHMDLKEIGGKTILGYKCRGYQAENEDGIYTFYITDEAGISYSDFLNTNQKNAPKGFDPEWLDLSNGLMMEMTVDSKKDPSQNMVMTCTGLEETQLAINKSDFQ